MRPSLAWLAALAIAGCGGSSLKEAGEECVASSECAAGLVCDLGASPPVCAGQVTADALEVDAPDMPIDAADPDGTPIDGAQIDARVDAAVDAGIDALLIDAETDAPPDA